MFILTTTVDTVRIPANMLALPTLKALHNELDIKYPNRVLMDIGLVICRYGDCLKITNGSCVPGDGGCHHECLFRLVVFRPFVEEVCTGHIIKSSPNGIQVSVGFFQDIFIPAYWMLRPSHYDEKLGLWVWQPNYDEEEDDEDETNDEDNDKGDNDAAAAPVGAGKNGHDTAADTSAPANGKEKIRRNDGDATVSIKQEDAAADETKANNEEAEEEQDGADRFEMEIGAEIRFKVKSIHFTQVTNTAKGVQATTTTTAHSQTIPSATNKGDEEVKSRDKPLRKRSISVDLTEASTMPATMKIVASICEDGLGCTSWWEPQEEEEGDEEDDEDAQADAEEDGAEDYDEEE